MVASWRSRRRLAVLSVKVGGSRDSDMWALTAMIASRFVILAAIAGWSEMMRSVVVGGGIIRTLGCRRCQIASR